MHTPGNFVLHGGDNAFANRQKLLFDKLSDAEQECNKNKMIAKSNLDMDVDDISSSQAPRSGQKRKIETKKFRGKESIFKRPEGFAPRAANRSVPDYHKNPHKWTKYSLDDVSNEDMTEQSNTRAALSFLKELKARRLMKKNEEEMDVDDSDSVKERQFKPVFKNKKIKQPSDIEFKKPEAKTEETENTVVVDNVDKPIFRSSKIIMPEYIVGQKQKRKGKKKKPAVKVERLKQLKLDHLEEPDEEED